MPKENKMNILIACERSGIVREAFRKKGHNAISCDLEPADDGSLNHIQGSVISWITPGNAPLWDMMIAHPPCTYLTVTGNKWFKPEYKERFPDREYKRVDAISFFMYLATSNIPKIAIENPVGIMSTVFRKPDQYIQPYEFGEPHAKKTCLWLRNLPKLTPTNIVEPEYVTYKSGKRMAKWYHDAARLPAKERERVRSQTFPGIAEAMAEQWG